jgi:GLPGLI family protein
MKYVTLTALLFFIPVSMLFAQNTTGQIRFTETIKLEMKMEMPPEMANSPEMKAMMAQMGDGNKSEKILYFDEKQCVYRDYEEPKKNDKHMRGGGGGMHFEFMMIKEQVISYHNLESHLLTESRDIFDKTFIVSDTAKKIKWKITTVVDTIAGYRCIKATYTKDTVVTQAWFAPEIKVSAGPENYYGLPGMILKIDIGNGRKVIEAKKVELAKPEAELLTAPKKGKKITRKEYDEILEKKLKEQAELEGGDGNTIRINMH